MKMVFVPMVSLRFPWLQSLGNLDPALTLVMGISVVIWMLCNWGRRKVFLPPGPRPLPVVGNLHILGKLPHRALASLSKKYGPIMFIRLGSVPTVVVSPPTIAKEFLKNHDLVFANRPKTSAGRLTAYDHHDIFWASYGEHWRQLRKLCTVELLTLKRIESFRHVKEEEVSGMIKSIWMDSNGGLNPMDLFDKLSFLTQNLICRMFASRTYTDDDLIEGHSFKEMIKEMFHLGGAFCVGDFIPWLSCLDLQGLQRRMKSSHRIYDAFADKVIDDHIASRRKSNAVHHHQQEDLVDVLLNMSRLLVELVMC